MAWKIHVTRTLCALTTASLLLSLGSTPSGGRAAEKNRDANKLYDQEAYEEALRLYLQAQSESPESPILHYNLGAALYKNDKLEEARKVLEHSLDGAPEELKPKVLYNLGNVLFKTVREQPDPSLLEQAAEFYRNALRLDPNDEDAKFNLELVLKELEKQSQQQDQQKQQEAGEDSEKAEQNGSQQEQQDKQEQQEQQPHDPQSEQQEASRDSSGVAPVQPEKLSKEDIEKILNALQQQEKETLTELREQETKPASTHDKDW